jgi:DNA sulfur modification protein DndB
LSGPNWQSQLAALEAIDWSKKNHEWENVCIVSNSVVSNRQARAATKAFIKAKLGLSLTDGEAKTLNASKVQAEMSKHLDELLSGKA